MMGIKSSPYLTTQRLGWAEEFICGYYCEFDNPFQWSNICLNFLGYSKYSPILPWVSKTPKERNLESYFWTYIDNIKRIAFT